MRWTRDDGTTDLRIISHDSRLVVPLWLQKQLFCLFQKESYLRLDHVPDRIRVEAVVAMNKHMSESYDVAML